MDDKNESVPPAEGSCGAADNVESRIAHRYNSTPSPHVLRLVTESQVSVVKGCVFTFIHHLEGKWSGEWQELSVTPTLESGGSMNIGPTTLPRAIATKVSYNSADGTWLMRETNTAEDGAATVLFLKLIPTGSGSISVVVHHDNVDGGQSMDTNGSVVTLKEVASGAQLERRHTVTGKLTLFELIVISDDSHLIRTTNLYSSDGNIQSVSISRQRRVITT